LGEELVGLGIEVQCKDRPELLVNVDSAGADGFIDLLVLDADASFRGSLRYAETWLPRITRATGLALILDTG
jgi:hypothetical protein